MDYNKTLNLPSTDFPMRAGLPTREPVFLDEVYDKKIYEQLLEKNENNEKFILHDGPPYANGDIHLGHALNKILKDFIIRYKSMNGFYAPYIPGWDTHGLPIESQVIKKGIKKDSISTTEFRKKCEEFARGYVDNQKEQFKRLGVLGEWENPYLTLQPEFEAKQIEVFGKMADKGYIYKGLKPVYWCPCCETALAEAEIEYADHKSTSIFVKFDVNKDNGAVKELIGTTENVKFVIWTTTTWTLPANVAISINPNFEYSFVKVENEILVLAKELVASVTKVAGIAEYEVLGTILGEKLEKIETKHPFIDRNSLIIVGEHVTLDAGTGCVHTAPGHGADDFEVCKNYDLPVIVPVNNKGVLTDDAGQFAGMYYEKSNKAILECLKESNHLLASQDIDHSYPHCWRCKNPIIFRATEQWFCSVDAFKDKAVDACKNIEFIPNWGQERIINMVKERHDWCISRQRVWGVPIPIFYCDKCGESIITSETTSKISSIFAKEGSNAWYDKSVSELIPDGLKCPKCAHTEFSKETDIMDVWFDSGSSHAAVLDVRENLSSPADLYLEGGDQHRGWFQSSLLTSMAAYDKAPYKAVLTHGWVVDGEGKKMSKSLGNVIKPQDVVNQFGADILRLWVSSADYKADMRISNEMFKQLSGMYLKIRNTARYILGNINEFDITNKTSFEDMQSIDKWAVCKANELVKKVSQSYETYEFHSVCHAIHHFCVVDMSMFYLDVIKDRLYCEDSIGSKRKSAQSAMHFILETMIGLIAPILSFTADEIYKTLPTIDAKKDNIVLTDFPKYDENLTLNNFNDWEKIILIREDVNKVLEKMRSDKIIGKPLEADVTLYVDESTDKILKTFGDELNTLFIVSRVSVNVADCTDAFVGESGVKIVATKSIGEKCERCWIFADSVGTSSAHKTLCKRCADVIEK